MACELSGLALSSWAIIAVVSAASAVALALAKSRRIALSRSSWPLPLWAYVMCPLRSPTLAIGSATLSIALLLLNKPWRKQFARWTEWLVLAMGLALYVCTMAPSVLPADAGELQLVCAEWGIAHPPGYPLYTLVGGAFARVPLGSPAYRVNLLSAIIAAGSLTLITKTVREETGSSSAALVSAATLGLSPTFWVQSTTANIRILTVHLTAWSILLLLRWARTRSRRDLGFAGFAVGLMVGHHGSMALVLPSVILFCLASDRQLLTQPRRWLAPVGGALLSLVVFAYLPLRSALGSPLGSSAIRTWSDMVEHVTASGFRGDMFHYRTWDDVVERLPLWGQIVRLQFGPLLLSATLFFSAFLARRRWRAALLLLGIWALNTLTAMSYRAPQTVEYLLPSYVTMALLLGLGLGTLRQRHRSAAGFISGALLVAILARGWGQLPGILQLNSDTTVRDEAIEVMHNAPENTLLLSDWHRVTVFRYLQRIEGLRPDLEIRYVYPQGDTPNSAVWRDRIIENMASRPVAVTNRFPDWDAHELSLTPLGRAWLVGANRPVELPDDATPLSAQLGEIKVVGLKGPSGMASPGGHMDVRVYWKPTRPLTQNYVAFLQMLGPEGVVAQGDHPHPSLTYDPEQMVVDAYRIHLLVHADPGAYRLIAGFYTVDPQGLTRLSGPNGDTVDLGTVMVAPRRDPLPTSRNVVARRTTFEGGWELGSIAPDRSVPGTLRLYVDVKRALAMAAGDNADGGPALTVSRGETILAQRTLPPLPTGSSAVVALDIADTTERLTLGLTDGWGRGLAVLGPWGLRGKGLTYRCTDPTARFVPLGGQVAFLGMDHTPGVLVPGTDIKATPRFLSLRSLTTDYAISWGIEGEGWRAFSDGTSAHGAIPTLKWLSGWRVADPRQVRVPTEAPSGKATMALTVYDATRVEPLPVLDERLVREGQGTRLRLATVPVKQ